MAIHEQKWHKGHVDPWWTDYEKLPYINEPFNDQQSLDLWRQLGFTQGRFTGDMYDMRQPEPDWIAPFRQYFDWQHFSWSVYRMNPGCVLPNHADTYARFVKLHNIDDPTRICRAVIFLEDWHSGHYFEIESQPLIQWHAGDWVAWRFDTLHLAANMGMTPRYTLQITGVMDEN